MAFLVYSGLFLLVQTPIRDAVIYYQEEEEAYASAAFWLLMGFSLVAIAFVLFLAGPLMERRDSCFSRLSGLPRARCFAQDERLCYLCHMKTRS